MQRLSKKEKVSATPSVQHVILLDRQLDVITPLATQLTYEGLIDEMFGLNNSKYLNIMDSTSDPLPLERVMQ